MADTGIFAWLDRAESCGDRDVERAALVMKDYYQGVGPEPEYAEQALASRPAEVEDEGYQSVPTEITREMMRAIQTQSELGAYACSNLSGAYNLINELWRIALSAAPSHTTNKEK